MVAEIAEVGRRAVVCETEARRRAVRQFIFLVFIPPMSLSRRRLLDLTPRSARKAMHRSSSRDDVDEPSTGPEAKRPSPLTLPLNNHFSDLT